MIKFCTVALKGGVGKTSTSVLLAQYAALRKNKRVLFIDTDGQGNSSLTIKSGGVATVSVVPASAIFTSSSVTIEPEPFVLLQADTAGLRVLEQQKDKRDAYATNFRNNMSALADQFDLCVIDTAPSTDIRLLSVLVSADFVLSPLQLNLEAITGMNMLLRDKNTGVHTIKAKLNPNMQFLGFLPNAVQATKNQRTNLATILESFLAFMFTSSTGQPMLIKQTTAVAEAMASGEPIFTASKSTAREAWKQMQPIFSEIMNRLFPTESTPNEQQ